MSDKSKLAPSKEVEGAAPDVASKLALKHGISPDRAQMLIDRMGEDSDRLDEAAKALRINPKTGGLA